MHRERAPTMQIWRPESSSPAHTCKARHSHDTHPKTLSLLWEAVAAQLTHVWPALESNIVRVTEGGLPLGLYTYIFVCVSSHLWLPRSSILTILQSPERAAKRFLKAARPRGGFPRFFSLLVFSWEHPTLLRLINSQQGKSGLQVTVNGEVSGLWLRENCLGSTFALQSQNLASLCHN